MCTKKTSTNVEIAVMLVYFVNYFTDAIFTNLIISRTCYVTLNYDRHLCEELDSIGHHRNNTMDVLEKDVQPYANVIIMVINISQAVIPAIICTIIGPWSDKNGRRPILISTVTGVLLSFIIKAFLSYTTKASPWLFLFTILPMILTGGLPLFYTMALCLIIDTTDDKTRGMRMSFYEAACLAGQVVGSFSSSYIYNATNYVIVFVLSSLILLISLLHVVFFIEESVIKNNDEAAFKLSDIFVVFKTMLKKRENGKRGVFYVALIILGLFILSYSSINGINYMFFRLKFHWNLEYYTIYQGILCILWISGNVLCVTIFHKWLRVSEKFLVLSGSIFLAFSYALMGFAWKFWHVVLALILRLPSGAVIPMLRTIISRTTSSEECGKIFSFTVILEMISSVIGIPAYVYLYNATLTTYPGAFYYVSSSLSLICCLLTIIIFAKEITKTN